jgi:hypothetical protein
MSSALFATESVSALRGAATARHTVRITRLDATTRARIGIVRDATRMGFQGFYDPNFRGFHGRRTRCTRRHAVD